jgi:putative tryptophan/tyrosine transport system substrate-binding protein
MQRFAKELVALQPDLILSHTTPTTTALLQQTRTIPIIFATVGDPVGSGFVASFPRPGGNVTGFNVSEPTLAGKWLELLKEIAPPVARVAMLFNPATATYTEYWLNPFKAAAASIAVEAIAAPVHDRAELELVFAAQAREPNGGLIVMPDSFMHVHRAEVTSLAARYRLPADMHQEAADELVGVERHQLVISLGALEAVIRRVCRALPSAWVPCRDGLKILCLEDGPYTQCECRHVRFHGKYWQVTGRGQPSVRRQLHLT